MLGSTSASGAPALDLLNAGTGALMWSAAMPAQVSGAGLFEGPVAGTGGTYAVQSIVGTDAAGDIQSINPTTGAMSWTYKTPGPCSEPAIADGVIYVTAGPTSSPAGSTDGELIALDGNGNPLFSADTGDVASPTIPLPPPAVADGRVYVGDFTGGLRVFGLSSG